jgi:hypothetical protein
VREREGEREKERERERERERVFNLFFVKNKIWVSGKKKRLAMCSCAPFLIIFIVLFV